MNTAPIRLVALDLDGTVFNDAKQLTPRTLQALTEAGRRGVAIVPATGRTITGVPAELLALPGVRYAITANGARVLDLADGSCLCQLYIPLETALAAYDILCRYDCLIDIFQDGQGYTTAANVAAAPDYVPANLIPYVTTSRLVLPDMRAFLAQQAHGIEKFTMFFRREEERQAAWRELEQLDLVVVSSLPLNMELNAAGVNKGSGLLQLAQVLGLPVGSLMACGDGGNDLEMVREAGLGVAMANAVDSVKAAADFITLSNNEDGVAYAVEKFVLPPEHSYDIRMVALDLDGTVLSHHNTITPRTAAAIEAAIRKGVVVLPATGRDLSGVPFVLASIPGVRYAVTTNGAAVWDMGETPVAAICSRYSDPAGNPVAEPTCLLSRPLPAETARAVWAMLRPLGGDLRIFADGRTHAHADAFSWKGRDGQQPRTTELLQKLAGRVTFIDDVDEWLDAHPGQVEKFCVFFPTAQQALDARAMLSSLPGVELVQGCPENVEVTAAGVDKGEALLALGAHLGLRREQILAVGDSDNDRAMLEKAGVAAVMANGMPHIKAIANIVSRNDCDHDGVAELLERLVL